MLEKQASLDSELSSADSWTTGESSQRSSDLGRGYSSGESSCSYQCVATLSGHSGPVSSIAVVGNRIYSGGSDGRDIRVWNQPDMGEICRFGTGNGAVKAIIMLGDRLISAHQDMKIRVWKQPEIGPKGPKGPKLVATLPTMKDYLLRCVPSKNYVQVRRHKSSLWIQHNDAISVLAAGPGNLLYSGSWDKTIKVWRTSDFRCLESITGHQDAVSSLVIDRQGFLYSASADSTVKVWSKCGGKKHSWVATLSKHKSSVNALALSPDESLLYAASSDKTVSVWERTNGGEEEDHMRFVGLLKGHRQAVLCMAAVGDIVCTGSADKTIRVWRRCGTDHTLVTVLEGHHGAVRSIFASMEAVELGMVIYSGSIDRSLKVWWLASSQHGSASPTGSPPLLLKWRQSREISLLPYSNRSI
ncbi:unnamed protein product [Calypogeia fissa]